MMIMTDARLQTCHGIIVHLTDYRDSDRIVDVLTLEQGRVSVLARGARASKRRFVGALDQFVALRMQIVKGRGLPILDSVDVQHAHRGIATQWSRFCRASVLCEMARALLPEASCVPEAYDALAFGLAALDQGDDLRAVHAYPALLRAVGIMPQYAEQTMAPLHDPIHDAAMGVLHGQKCVDHHVAARVERYMIAWVEEYLGRLLHSRVALGL